MGIIDGGSTVNMVIPSPDETEMIMNSDIGISIGSVNGKNIRVILDKKEYPECELFTNALWAPDKKQVLIVCQGEWSTRLFVTDLEKNKTKPLIIKGNTWMYLTKL